MAHDNNNNTSSLLYIPDTIDRMRQQRQDSVLSSRCVRQCLLCVWSVCSLPVYVLVNKTRTDSETHG